MCDVSGASLRYVTQDAVQQAARDLVRSAERTLDVASPWIEPWPVQRLLADALPRVREGSLRVRVVYRVAEESDLRITDLAALDALAEEGVELRYSRRLHAKLVIADRERALVGSSNLTRRGGHGYAERREWRNEEGGILTEDADTAGAAATHFDAIWDAADAIRPTLLGVVADFPTVRSFRFVAVRDVAAGELVVVSDEAGDVVGEIEEVTTYNPSFPQMTEEMFLSQGFSGAPPRRVQVPDLPDLFSHPLKEHGFLVAKTYLRPESAFRLARVRVLRSLGSDGVVRPAEPLSPGADVIVPSPELLRRLLGGGDLELGRLERHRDAPVWLRSRDLLATHLAVLGMTGSGKSNGVKLLVRALRPSEQGLRAVVVDTHGEYAALMGEIDPAGVAIDVTIPDKVDLLDFEMVKEHFAVERMTAQIKNGLRQAGRSTTDPAGFAAALAAAGNDVLADIAAQVAADPDAYCVGEEEPRIVDVATGNDADLTEPGLYVLDLRATDTFAVRSKKCAILAERLFRDVKGAGGGRPTLLVVDEAHNYVPERTTGFMAEASKHGSLGALTAIAVEGRKFGLGLVIVSQRPSRIAKDVLAQMGSQLVFRLANLEDLSYVRESFEAAGASLLVDLPQLDTGVCVAAGAMIDLPVRCRVPLFGDARDLVAGTPRSEGASR